MLKEKISCLLKEETTSFNFKHKNTQFTASYIAEKFNVKRNTISHYLNQLVDEGKIIKINTRPVYFLDRNVFEQIYFPVETCEFKSLEQLEMQGNEEPHTNSFSNLIGWDSSLSKIIEQAKTSILYPGSGLPLMFYGPTGTGKSMLAKMIWQYAKDNEVLDEEAPFIVFNCAQYANNPELLSSKLFGHVKGAFTGAHEMKKGVLDAAHMGILFLDEVHWLNAESQEKLFNFMDQGSFQRMGDSDNHHVNVRLMFATTKKQEGQFLDTFLRRIPFQIYVPSLDERGRVDKTQFVYYFLLKEVNFMNRSIECSSLVIDILSKHSYRGNIGELKNVIKILSASAYARAKEQPILQIKIWDVPEYLLTNAQSDIENKMIQQNVLRISPQQTLGQIYEEDIPNFEYMRTTFQRIFRLFHEEFTEPCEFDIFETKVVCEFNVMLDKLIFEQVTEQDNRMLRYTITSIQNIFEYIRNQNYVDFNGNNLHAISYYFYFRNRQSFLWNSKEKKMRDSLYDYVLEHAQEENKIAMNIVNLISTKLEIDLDKEDEIFLSFYLKGKQVEQKHKHVKAIVIAHGYATASSIANVVNRMLNGNLIEPFDMPWDIEVQEIAAKIMHYSEHNDVSEGLLILVDMGSLKEVYDNFTKTFDSPIAIINNVSTQMALQVGDLLKRDFYLEEVVEQLKMQQETQYKIIYPNKIKDKMIVTTCFTGIGTAVQLQNLLKESIPEALGIKVVAHDYERLKARGTKEALFQLHDVVGILGTQDPNIENVTYMSVEDLISGSGEDKLRKIFISFADEDTIQTINNNIVRNFSLERVIESLTILDTNKILKHVEQALSALELAFKQRIKNDKKISLYIHVSCMIERLIRQSPIEHYPDESTYKDGQKDMMELIENAFSVLENKYSVKIPSSEIGYIYDIVSADFGE